MFFSEDIPRGSKRDRKSGALIFPIHPRDIERIKKEAELDKELNDIRELKKELQDILKEVKGED